MLLKEDAIPREALATAKQQLESELGDVTQDASYQSFKDPTKFIPAELAEQRATIRKAIAKRCQTY